MPRNRAAAKATRDRKEGTKKKTDDSGELGAKKVPKCFVLQTGEVGETLKKLKQDIRRVMEPNTAIRLKETRSNVLKDFLVMAGPLGVTHFMILSSTEYGSYLRVAKAPHGPTLVFKLDSYSLMSDVSFSQKRPVGFNQHHYNHAPLLILNNFPTDEAGNLMSTLFRNLFPAINVLTIRLKECRRVVLMTYNKETKLIEMRHYLISGVPTGVGKRIRNLVQRKLPKNLGKANDLVDYMMGLEGAASQSEGEDDSENIVKLEQDYAGLGNSAGHAPSTALRLREVGPRITMQLVKIQAEFNGGKVLYHERIHKTPEEIAAMDKMIEQKKQEKLARKKQQEENVQKKKKTKSEDPEVEDPETKSSVAEDMEWYEKEVGEKANEMDFANVGSEKKKDYHKYSKKHKKVQDEDQVENEEAEEEKGSKKRKSNAAPEKSAKSPQKKKAAVSKQEEVVEKAPAKKPVGGKVLKKRGKSQK